MELGFSFDYTLTALVTVLMSITVFMFSLTVGKSRAKADIKAPAMTGDDTVERAIRVHMNSIEQMAIFLPVMWVFAIMVSDLYAAIAGLIWIVGRLIYARGYMEDPSKRSTGFMIGFLPYVVIAIWALIDIILVLLD